jgi:excisionase family DNA binding protein
MSTSMTTSFIEGAEFSATDRRSISAAAARISGDGSIPRAVRDIAAAMLERIADGESVALVGSDDLLSPNQAAALVGVSRPLLNRLLDDGRIPFFATEGGHRKIKRSDVDLYVEDRDKITAQLAKARRERRSVNEEVADELGLTAEQSKRLGLA